MSTRSHSRDAMRPEFCKTTVPHENQGAQGRPGARCTRGPAGGLQKDMLPTSIQVQRRAPGLPCAMALRLIRDRPGDPALCDTIALGQLSPPSNLTPASGRRTLTTSPYANAALVSRSLRVHRSLSHVRDDGQRPFDGTGCGRSKLVLPDRESGIFFWQGLDPYPGVICPSGSL